MRVIPVRYRGEPHVLSVVRDITERKHAEARAAAARRAVPRDLRRRHRRDGAVEPRPAHRRCEPRLHADVRLHARGEHRLGVRRAAAGRRKGAPQGSVRARAGRRRDADRNAVRTPERRTASTSSCVTRRSRYRGEPHVLSVVRDITERKQAEAALQLREEQYRAIFDGATDAMVLWSRDIRIVDVNRGLHADVRLHARGGHRRRLRHVGCRREDVEPRDGR